MTEIILKEEAYQVMGACYEVHNELGSGFLEAVYQECLEIEFNDRKIPYRSQPSLAIHYKNRTITKVYQPDFVCFDSILIEIKAVSELSNAHRAQVLNYLKATGLNLGLLINFGSQGKLKYERLALTRH